MISLIITILIDYKKNKHIGDKNPRVTRGYPQTRWVRVWAKFQTRHGYGFFNGCKYFSRVRVWDSKTRRVCTRCHLYSRFSRSRRLALTTKFLCQQTMTSTPVASLHAICNLHAMSVVASHSPTPQQTPARFSTRKKEGAHLDKVASASPVAATAEWRLVPIIGGSFPH